MKLKINLRRKESTEKQFIWETTTLKVNQRFRYLGVIIIYRNEVDTEA